MSDRKILNFHTVSFIAPGDQYDIGNSKQICIGPLTF